MFRTAGNFYHGQHTMKVRARLSGGGALDIVWRIAVASVGENLTHSKEFEP